MKYWIEKRPYWLSDDGVKKLEEMKDATFMGQWCVRTRTGWSDEPVDVFYQPDPDTDAGHTHYFGIYITQGRVMITGADEAFPKDGVMGAVVPNGGGEVLVSRYRHDYISRGGVSVDGGRDYMHSSGTFQPVRVTVKGPDFEFRHI